MFNTFDMNGPFGLYAMHTSELDNIVADIVNQYEMTGSLNFDIPISPTFSLTMMDLDYIQTQVEKLIGG